LHRDSEKYFYCLKRLVVVEKTFRKPVYLAAFSCSLRFLIQQVYGKLYSLAHMHRTVNVKAGIEFIEMKKTKLIDRWKAQDEL
jgi:hypothetical protein